MEPATARDLPSGSDRSPPRKLSRQPIRLMIVDDSLTARTVLKRMAESDGDLQVVAVASAAKNAIEELKSIQVDVILLDLQMPGLSGLEALPRIIEAARGARILVVSSLTIDGAEQSLAALSQGAADTLPKPASGDLNAYCDILLGKIRALGRATATGARLADRRPPRLASRGVTRIRAQVLAIGASTGGIHALSTLFAALPHRLGIPILVTQHLPGSFMPVFARQLKLASGYDAVVAEEDMPLLPDRILVAPGHAHMMIHGKPGGLKVRLDQTPASSGCMPSVDPMFASLADVLGDATLGVVLSGMGRDGVDGAAKVVAKGGSIFAQDEATCAVWGMPRAVAEAGLASAIAPPQQIASRIIANASLPAWK